MNKKDKILLVLDLDETLIHSTKLILKTEPDFKYEDYFVYFRPGVSDFLEKMSLIFDLAVWSSGEDKYVEDLVDAINPKNIHFEFIWGRSRCTKVRDYELEKFFYEKRLKKLKNKGFSIEKILIVDDSPEKSRDNYGNAIYIKPFEGDPEDKELIFLAQYLETVKDKENIRKLEKRGWRDRFIK